MYLLQGDYNKVKTHCKDFFENDYFEFELSYVPENEKFREIDRFLWESRHECTRYKNKYNGNLVVGLTEWNSNASNKYFDAFMYFLKDYLRFARSCVLFVEEQASESLLSAVGKHFCIVKKELSLTVKQGKKTRRIGFYLESDERSDNNVRSKV